MIKALLRRAYMLIGSLLSKVIETDYKKIVLICNYGRGYLCNPKYIAEGLTRYYPNQFEIVLLTKQYDATIPQYIQQRKYRGIGGLFALCSARFWINNCREPLFVPKRADQLYIQTWHGYAMMKKVELDAGNALGEEYRSIAQKDGKLIDLMFTDNSFQERIFHNSFWYSGPVLRCDVPRNEPLIQRNHSIADRVRAVFSVEEGVRICLFAPTFRKDSSLDAHCIDFTKCIHALEDRFGSRFVMMYRLHPNIAALERPAFFEGCIDATSYLDTQELLVAVDVLISDYSSIMEDFVLTEKPAFMYVPDIDKYVDDRGFYYDPSLRPFPLAKNEEELYSEIREYNEAEASMKRKAFLNYLGFEDNGNGCKAIADVIKTLSNPGTAIDNVLEGRTAQSVTSNQGR